MRRLLLLLFAVALGLSACTEDDPSLAVSTTVTGIGVRAHIDNCPGATAVRIRAGETVLWEISRPSAPPGEPSEFDVLVGEAPRGWQENVALAAPLESRTRYVLATEPEGDLLAFSLDELEPGRLLTEDGEERATPVRIERSCPEDTVSAGEFGSDLAVLTLLGLCVIGALAIVVILVLHLVNRVLRRPSI